MVSKGSSTHSMVAADPVCGLLPDSLLLPTSPGNQCPGQRSPSGLRVRPRLSPWGGSVRYSGFQGTLRSSSPHPCQPASVAKMSRRLSPLQSGG